MYVAAVALSSKFTNATHLAKLIWNELEILFKWQNQFQVKIKKTWKFWILNAFQDRKVSMNFFYKILLDFWDSIEKFYGWSWSFMDEILKKGVKMKYFV